MVLIKTRKLFNFGSEEFHISFSRYRKLVEKNKREKYGKKNMV